MKIAYCIGGIVFPFILQFPFMIFHAKQLHRTDPAVIARLEYCGFPEDEAGLRDMPYSFQRKFNIYAALFIACALLLWALPAIGQIAYWICDAILVFFCFGQYSALRIAKRAKRAQSRVLQAHFRPIIRIYRAALLHMVVLTLCFVTFLDLATH